MSGAKRKAFTLSHRLGRWSIRIIALFIRSTYSMSKKCHCAGGSTHPVNIYTRRTFLTFGHFVSQTKDGFRHSWYHATHLLQFAPQLVAHLHHVPHLQLMQLLLLFSFCGQTIKCATRDTARAIIETKGASLANFKEQSVPLERLR